MVLNKNQKNFKKGNLIILNIISNSFSNKYNKNKNYTLIKKNENFYNLIKNKKEIKKYLYFARKKRYKNNWNKCEKELIKKLFIKKIIFPENKYQILKMNTFEVTNFLIKKLRKNKHYLIK